MDRRRKSTAAARAGRKNARTRTRNEVVENESSTKPVSFGPPSVPGYRDTWGPHDPAQSAHSLRFLSLAQPWGELRAAP